MSEGPTCPECKNHLIYDIHTLNSGDWYCPHCHSNPKYKGKEVPEKYLTKLTPAQIQKHIKNSGCLACAQKDYILKDKDITIKNLYIVIEELKTESVQRETFTKNLIIEYKDLGNSFTEQYEQLAAKDQEIEQIRENVKKWKKENKDLNHVFEQGNIKLRQKFEVTIKEKDQEIEQLTIKYEKWLDKCRNQIKIEIDHGDKKDQRIQELEHTSDEQYETNQMYLKEWNKADEKIAALEAENNRNCLICTGLHSLSVPICRECYKLMQLTQKEINEKYIKLEQENASIKGQYEVLELRYNYSHEQHSEEYSSLWKRCQKAEAENATLKRGVVDWVAHCKSSDEENARLKELLTVKEVNEIR